MPIQLAIADFIDSGQYARHLKTQRFDLLLHKRRYCDYLQQRLLETARISDPAGGLVLWIQIPGIDDAKFKSLLLESELDVRLGECFTLREVYRDSLRINIGYALPEPGEPDNAAKCSLDHLISVINRAMTDK